ncbi:type II secretion system F family protein [Cellulomonas composti]|uniref:Type II secretion system protein GspF domain-containing protein n=1 Tax=Cellulomonas composti TaxID=266130 RepID=A0A511JDC3_9CELL|nr:type II secretion system F family protein [Cellulomonas composti]GEL95789.1 hypothetical protein CCO02nite_24470 [Cellulomonas composti]
MRLGAAVFDVPLLVGLLVLSAVVAVPWFAARRVGPGRAGGGPGAAQARRGGRARRGAEPDRPDPVAVLDLVDAALSAGAAVPRALEAVGAAVGGDDGAALSRAGAALVLGASWQVAWAGSPAVAAVVRDALRPAWTTGVAPGPALRARAARERRERRRRARTQAGALAVRLVLPLGLCFLPAFVLLGLAPLVLGLVGDLLG